MMVAAVVVIIAVAGRCRRRRSSLDSISGAAGSSGGTRHDDASIVFRKYHRLQHPHGHATRRWHVTHFVIGRGFAIVEFYS